jgi:hypothetical protein
MDNKCLDIKDSNPNDGAPVQMWDCSGGINQQVWKFLRIPLKCFLKTIHNKKTEETWNWLCFLSLSLSFILFPLHFYYAPLLIRIIHFFSIISGYSIQRITQFVQKWMENVLMLEHSTLVLIQTLPFTTFPIVTGHCLSTLESKISFHEW